MALKIISVVGARPNFIKISPFMKVIKEHNESCPADPVENLLVHTGQHYHLAMSQTFFRSLGIPEPDVNLEVGSGSQAEQVGLTMKAFEKILVREKPDWVVVVGDVNATLACALTAKKEGVQVCHIEAGLRSRDMSMPEEVNRLVTDCLADLLLTPDRLSSENLRREGIADGRIVFVGNIMIDTLEENRKKAAALDPESVCMDNRIAINKEKQLSVKENGYALMTMHRPSNVDDPAVLRVLVEFLCNEVAPKMPLVWPIHPRSMNRLKEFDLWAKVENASGVVLLKPIGYHEMLCLNMDARIMLTDSGGLQEECTILGTPCLTLRKSTERPITLREHGGASVLVGNDLGLIRSEFNQSMNLPRRPVRPELWDGNAAKRCVEAIRNCHARYSKLR
jgi:UDP-N-acetylglucosamine 2-epimerase (non-hydrolysing)